MPPNGHKSVTIPESLYLILKKEVKKNNSKASISGFVTKKLIENLVKMGVDIPTDYN